MDLKATATIRRDWERECRELACKPYYYALIHASKRATSINCISFNDSTGKCTRRVTVIQASLWR